jgi:RNA polymerase sigma-70 factor (ECF subfamily)
VVSSNYKKDKINISSDAIEMDFASHANPETDLMHSQSLNNVRSFINSLPENLRTAFTLRESDGLSYEEISLITDTPIGTVRSRIFRARESVLEFMSQESTNEK